MDKLVAGPYLIHIYMYRISQDISIAQALVGKHGYKCHKNPIVQFSASPKGKRHLIQKRMNQMNFIYIHTIRHLIHICSFLRSH